MTDSRGDGRDNGHHDGDPFAELAEIIGRDTDAHSQRFSTPPAGEPEPFARRSMPGSGAPRSFYSDDETSQLGLATIGLCEPATPRIVRPAESGALAPERYQPEPEPVLATTDLDDFDELIASELAVLRPTPVARPAAAHAIDDDTAFQAARAHAQSYLPDDVTDTRTRYDEPAQPQPEPDSRFLAQAAWERSVIGGQRRRRMMFFGGGVAAVALVGAFGLFAGSSLIGAAIGGDGEPVLIRADAEPVKMAPADPGGRVVPNQNKAVYERVARGGPVANPPAQGLLISAAEEPLDISFEEEVSNLPGVMVGMNEIPVATEMLVAQAPEPAEGTGASVLQPHRVRTFEVRPDGTLVPRGEPAPVVPGAAPADTFDPVAATTQPAVPFSVDLPQATPEAAPATAPQAPAPEPAVSAAETASVPDPAPAAAATVTPPADAFFVQISSQPTAAAARDSMASLSGRYASAIGGRQLTIQPAEIEGRGTFHRVRIITASRDEANSVCAQFQSAGGSCFVTR